MTKNEELLKKEIDFLKKKVAELEDEKKQSFRTARFMKESKDIYGHFDKDYNLVSINKSGEALFKKTFKGNPIGQNIKILFNGFLPDYKSIKAYLRGDKMDTPLEMSFQNHFYALHYLKIEQRAGFKIVDITKQVGLRGKEQQLSEVISAIPELFYKSRIYPDGKKEVEYLSPQIKDVMGFTYEEYIQNLRAGKLADYLHPDDKTIVYETLKKVANTKKPVKMTYRFFHYTKKKYVWLEETTFPKFDEKGKRIANYGLTRDVSNEMEAKLALEKSEENYKMLINQSPMGIAILDDKERLLFANERAKLIFKIKDITELAKANVFEAIAGNEQFLQRYYDRKKDLEKYGETPFVEFDIFNAKGERTIIQTKVNAIKYENKNAIQITFQDITYKKQIEDDRLKLKIARETNKALKQEIKERKELEKQLLEAKSYTENIIRSSIDNILTSDEKNNIIELNQAALDTFGYKKEEIIGKKVDILYKYPEERQQVYQSLKSTGEFVGEIISIRKDGTTFISYLSASYLYDSDGKIIGSMGISKDITQVRENQRKMREQASRLKSIIESSSHSFWTYSRETGITSFNQNYAKAMQSLYGSVPKINEHYNEIEKLPKEEREKMQVDWEHKYGKVYKGFSLRFETEGKNKKGETIYRELFLTPIINADDVITEVSGIAHDITKQKLAEKELRKSLKEKEVLLQEVHHRVKNNLQIISSIFNLQASYIKDEKVLQMLAESQNRIKSMAFIHEALYQNKDFSKINFAQYIETLSNNLLYSYDIKGGIDLQLEVQQVHLDIDTAIPCGLIVNELVTNSMKYAFSDSKKGKISISLRRKNEEVELIIADNGKGIPANINFMDTESLGLQLVVTLVEQIDGKISLNSKEGTIFTINFKA